MSFHSLRAEGITGRDVTPFILQKVNDLTKGKSLQASILLTREHHHTNPERKKNLRPDASLT